MSLTPYTTSAKQEVASCLNMSSRWYKSLENQQIICLTFWHIPFNALHKTTNRGFAEDRLFLRVLRHGSAFSSGSQVLNMSHNLLPLKAAPCHKTRGKRRPSVTPQFVAMWRASKGMCRKGERKKSDDSAKGTQKSRRKRRGKAASAISSDPLQAPSNPKHS